jgi:hypothetical protein
VILQRRVFVWWIAIKVSHGLISVWKGLDWMIETSTFKGSLNEVNVVRLVLDQQNQGRS